MGASNRNIKNSFGARSVENFSSFQQDYRKNRSTERKPSLRRNDALLRRISRPRSNGRVEGGDRRVRPLKIIFLRDWWIKYAVDNVIVLTES